MQKINWKTFLMGVAFGMAPLLFWALSHLMIDSSEAQTIRFRRAIQRYQPAKSQTNPTLVTQISSDSLNQNAEMQQESAIERNAEAGQEETITMKPFPGSDSQWKRGFSKHWIAEEKERHMIKPPADNKAIVNITDSQKEGDTYGNYTEKDLLLWEKETERLVVEGSLIFHNADLLGSTNGTSCDMCHPDAEGTHAETYPKYQVQLGRAALLRDMANWCLENPCRAEPMSGDDHRMRALEAYMQAQRTGKPMKYGKH